MTRPALPEKLLYSFYTDFNKRYFKNRLPRDIKIHYTEFNRKPDLMGLVSLHPDIKTIWISRYYSRSMKTTLSILLHEMVHFEHPEWMKHGLGFEQRMRGLVRAGAYDELL